MLVDVEITLLSAFAMNGGQITDNMTGKNKINVSPSDYLYLLFGDRVNGTPEGCYRELLDMGVRVAWTGEFNQDGSPISCNDCDIPERAEMPPPPEEQ